MPKSLIFLILSFVMGFISACCGGILRGINAPLYLDHSNKEHYYSFMQNLHIGEIHLVIFNIFFAVLFVVFLIISFMLTKENKK